MRTLYDEIEPYETGYLQVSSLHSLYYEQSGNPQGKPVVFLHGGPGAGSEPIHRRFFSPKAYRIIIFDQRGAGRSKPHACLEENTTWHLVEDIERLRGHLGIDRWVVFGGSWGSTLALAYAQTYPQRVKALALRGIFLCRPEEITWFYQKGADAIFPDFWEEYLAPIPQEERSDMIAAYYRRLTSEDETVRLAAARAWSIWEGSTSKLYVSQALIDNFAEPHKALALARIECHYFINNAFMPTNNHLIENVPKIRHIPAVIVQGRYDIVCPMMSAWQLHKAWPEARFQIIPDAGHSVTEPGITDALIRAMDEFAEL
ncbi:MAG: prolyl aminopeptidase [Acidobacteriota bacterium]|nr:prolyl aminopeptidase [Blastocatellia bacterium]MDW8413754.1 prolyl aminopeptidase [Acidobacteriota bacterium]